MGMLQYQKETFCSNVFTVVLLYGVLISVFCCRESLLRPNAGKLGQILIFVHSISHKGLLFNGNKFLCIMGKCIAEMFLLPICIISD